MSTVSAPSSSSFTPTATPAPSTILSTAATSPLPTQSQLQPTSSMSAQNGVSYNASLGPGAGVGSVAGLGGGHDQAEVESQKALAWLYERGFNRGEFSDITLHCPQHSVYYPLHRIILARSPLLEELMRSRPTLGQHLVLEIPDESITADSLSICLAHLYAPSTTSASVLSYRDSPSTTPHAASRALLATAILLRLPDLIEIFTSSARSLITSLTSSSSSPSTSLETEISAWIAWASQRRHPAYSYPSGSAAQHFTSPGAFTSLPLPETGADNSLLFGPSRATRITPTPPRPTSLVGATSPPAAFLSSPPPPPHLTLSDASGRPYSPAPGGDRPTTEQYQQYQQLASTPMAQGSSSGYPEIELPAGFGLAGMSLGIASEPGVEGELRYGMVAEELLAIIMRHLTVTLPTALHAFAAAPTQARQGHAYPPDQAPSAGGIRQADADGQATLMRTYVELPWDMLKDILESLDLPVVNDRERFNFAKKTVAERKKAGNQPPDVEDTVVLSFGGGDRSGVSLVRKTRKGRTFWKVEG